MLMGGLQRSEFLRVFRRLPAWAGDRAAECFCGHDVAMAAQPKLENFISGIMIYAALPVRAGDVCNSAHEGRG